MANLTLFVPDELKKRMEKHSEIRWSAAVRNIIKEKLEDLEEVEELAKKSRLTEEDARVFAEMVNKKMGKRAEELLDEISRGR